MRETKAWYFLVAASKMAPPPHVVMFLWHMSHRVKATRGQGASGSGRSASSAAESGGRSCRLTGSCHSLEGRWLA
jgi:hypothetical protein